MCNVFDVLMDADCGTNMGGTSQELYLAGVNDFASFGARKTPIVNPIDEYTITGPHIFKSGKAWKKVQILKDSGVNNLEPGGANSGAKSKTQVFRIPSKNKSAIALINKFANGVFPLIALVHDNNMPAGEYDQYGTAEYHATLTVSKNNGTASGDGSVFEFTLSVVQPELLVYTGAVTLTPAT
jgi:hypothetical protein